MHFAFTADKRLPINQRAIRGSYASELRHLANRTVAAKKNDAAADTSALERKINQQVYALNGLTPEEIAIVEGSSK